ncbi:hypothetical protein C8N47_10235 [Mangrovibacterium marinum]|uniref:Uncharacterized protein n=1 Tax=Mangrovibacterium marinum TaxID=1639118 RepID=A0A2T5C580_9BACT|nr:hypothetical protein C8N47_10235 [Mangrovibacterium marinum]
MNKNDINLFKEYQDQNNPNLGKGSPTGSYHSGIFIVLVIIGVGLRLNKMFNLVQHSINQLFRCRMVFCIDAN